MFFFTTSLIIICRIFERDGVKLVVDKISYDFVKGATVDYVEELIRSAFLVGLFILSMHCFLACMIQNYIGH